MSLQKYDKVKQLYKLLPEGVIIPGSWLVEQDYSRQLINKYVKSGILKKIGFSSYARVESPVKWEGVIIGIQKFAKLSFYVGGITALELWGFAHYLPLGNSHTITIYGKKSPPAWIKKIEVDRNQVFYKKPWFEMYGLKPYFTNIRDFEILISSPERALLEMLYLVEKDGITFKYAAEIFENLTSLRPSLLNKLLLKCKSIKVKRLFFYLSDMYNYPWTKYIDKNIDIGTGKMQIVKNGKLDNKYLITVPKDFYAK
jgi:hypothetical protein